MCERTLSYFKTKKGKIKTMYSNKLKKNKKTVNSIYSIAVS